MWILEDDLPEGTSASLLTCPFMHFPFIFSNTPCPSRGNLLHLCLFAWNWYKGRKYRHQRLGSGDKDVHALQLCLISSYIGGSVLFPWFPYSQSQTLIPEPTHSYSPLYSLTQFWFSYAYLWFPPKRPFTFLLNQVPFHLNVPNLLSQLYVTHI